MNQQIESLSNLLPILPLQNTLMLTLDACLGSKFLGTNLDSFEANGILELDHALDLSLHLGSPNHELSFWGLFFFFFGLFGVQTILF